jgi:hypothetical protein
VCGGAQQKQRARAPVLHLIVGATANGERRTGNGERRTANPKVRRPAATPPNDNALDKLLEELTAEQFRFIIPKPVELLAARGSLLPKGLEAVAN